jgi:hypothetical protein
MPALRAARVSSSESIPFSGITRSVSTSRAPATTSSGVARWKRWPRRISGANLWQRRSARRSKEMSRTSSSIRASRTTAMVRASMPSSSSSVTDSFLISIITLARPRAMVSTSASVGTRSEANLSPKRSGYPADSLRSSAKLSSPTRPVPSVVRSTEPSWITTT